MPAMFGEKVAISPIGPKIRFSVDVPWELFERPGIRTILRALSLEAPRTFGDVVVITSAWRPPVDQFSWHSAACALDVRTGLVDSMQTAPGAIIGPNYEARLEIARAWAVRCRLRLGSEYDVIFGDPAHLDHLHLEHDGTKASARFQWATV